MPLVRDRNFYHFGAEALMAYYGVDEKSVEMTVRATRILVISKPCRGNPWLRSPLIEKQGHGDQLVFELEG